MAAFEYPHKLSFIKKKKKKQLLETQIPVENSAGKGPLQKLQGQLGL